MTVISRQLERNQLWMLVFPLGKLYTYIVMYEISVTFNLMCKIGKLL